VLDVIPFDEEDESPFVGLLQVEAVQVLPASWKGAYGERPLCSRRIRRLRQQEPQR
jgi:hypothetical protein